MAKITYINKVEKIDAVQLSSSTFMSKGVSLENALAWEKVCLVGLASLEIEEKVEGRLMNHYYRDCIQYLEINISRVFNGEEIIINKITYKKSL